MKKFLTGMGVALPLAATLVAVPGAQAAPGDDGDIKVHKVTTGIDDERNDPQVCRFYLDAFNFDGVRRVLWRIYEIAPTGDDRVMRGTLRIRDGRGYTYPMTLPQGHYKVTWTYPRENGAGKSKVFQVTCDNPWTPPRPNPPVPPNPPNPPNPPTPPGPPGPNPPTPDGGGGTDGGTDGGYPAGGVDAGGGGLAAG
ncbi:hypothetical protein ACIBKX_02535 [Streptomyces sp. NPDC050658]|uniref:hypothetical protein n=1 Tax=unclassified Streptomyces TaxID=2593676 RepID=UPI00342E4AF2